jgi:hypothetical protein
MTILLNYGLSIVNDLLLHLLVFDLVQLFLLLQVFGEKFMNLMANYFAFLEVLNDLEADQRYFSKFASLFLAQASFANTRNLINFLQNLILEHIILQSHISLDQSFAERKAVFEQIDVLFDFL